MIYRVSENKTRGKCLRCRFLANATMRRSRVWSLSTAARSNYRSGAHHMSAHVIWRQYQQLEGPVPVGERRKLALDVEQKDITM